MLSFGNTGYNTALRVGASHAGKAFLGGVQVWPCITEPPPPGPDVSRIRWDGITGWSSTAEPVTIGEVVAGDSITTGTVGSIEVLY